MTPETIEHKFISKLYWDLFSKIYDNLPSYVNRPVSFSSNIRPPFSDLQVLHENLTRNYRFPY